MHQRYYIWNAFKCYIIYGTGIATLSTTLSTRFNLCANKLANTKYNNGKYELS